MILPWLILVPLIPVVTLLGLHSIWWTFALYHLGACVVLPLVHSMVVRKLTLREHLELVGLVRPGHRLGPGIRWGLALGGLLGLGTLAAFALGHQAWLGGRDIPAILEGWGVAPDRAMLMLAFMVLGNGACEELYWRGWLHTRMAARRGRGSPLAAIAAAYTSYHAVTVGSFTGSLAVALLFLAAIFGAGLLFGVLRERFGTVWAPLLVHTGATAGYMAVYSVWVA